MSNNNNESFNLCFSLVTDQGYLEAKNVIWEEINFSGGGDFYNENFVTRQEAIAEQTARDAQIAQQVSKDDEKLARQLQQQEQERYRRTNQRDASNQRQLVLQTNSGRDAKCENKHNN